ncbi:MAG TPA: phosphate ABC transporter, permease protein PstA, partial [Gammaproteobacteria bacterium]|nr:phosphate ABC transporter, permease protein PstA [Gammaproteobacteria bacterium]
MSRTVKSWFGGDAPWIWLHAGAISISLLLVAGLLALLMLRGLGHFWPGDVAVFELTDADGGTERVIGEIVERETLDIAKVAQDSDATGHGLIDRYLIKTGNREISGIDFRWVSEPQMSTPEYPVDIMVLERREWGNFYGFPKRLMETGGEVDLGGAALPQVLQTSLDAASGIFAEIRHIEKDLIGAINYRMERLRLRERRLQLEGAKDPEAALVAERAALQRDYDRLVADLESLYENLNRGTLIAVTASGEETEIPLAEIVRAYYPNAMNPAQKSGFYLRKLGEFLSEEPREANTEGGIYPAIFGTV